MTALHEKTETVETGPGRPGASATELAITGMTCGNCARHVTEAIQSVPGVRSATVNLDANQATVRWVTDVSTDVSAVIKAVEDEGYGAKVMESSSAGIDAGALSGWRLNLLVGVPVTAVLMLGEWALHLGMAPWFRVASFVLAGVVQIVAGARFYRGAWGQLKAGSSNMDTLVALGSTTAFAYSVWALFAGQGDHLYFMEAASIITLISAGHWIESRVSARASSALRQLLDLAPALARRRNPDGSETEVPAAELRPGDFLVLRPGDRIPTDAEVTEGGSVVDESMLTGESVPADKRPGSPVYAGTLNVNGLLVARVTATGEDTALAHIIAAVQRAQTSRANIQRLGDRVSNVFVPIVVSVALLAALWWGLAPTSVNLVHTWLSHFLWPAHPPTGQLAAAFIIAAGVLIIACPCAMGLATPAAIMAGSNAAAQRGILIRDGIALEKAGQVTAVVFDKTGTLTEGKPTVEDVWAAQKPSTEMSELIKLAAGLASRSAHPISQAVAKLGNSSVTFASWEEIHGAGVQGKIEGASLRLGSLRWLKDSGVDLAPGDEFVRRWTAEGATLIGLGRDRQLVALFVAKDTLKTGASAVIAQLRRDGLKVYLVTGDNAQTAASLARLVGIEPQNVFAEVRPEKKAEFVKQRQELGERVAFIGDGINDAPALEQADLGIAVTRASDIAREAADIILLKSEIEAVPESLGLARATLRTIKQNLFWAFFYNAVGVPLAALGFLSPILCAAAMGLSDLVVIGNALRLRRWRLT
jgi:Cu+-exporting ATPase